MFISLTVVIKFSPPPEFDLSKKFILVKVQPKETCPRNICEIPGGLNLTTTVRIKDVRVRDHIFWLLLLIRGQQYLNLEVRVRFVKS